MKNDFILKFKSDVNIQDINGLTKPCVLLLSHFMEYCRENDLPCRITSLISDRSGVKSKSSTHADGRAFDASVHGWDTNEIDDCVLHFNARFEDIAAISSRNNEPRVCVFHNSGYGLHFHFQVRPNGV